MKCPECASELAPTEHPASRALVCPEGHGQWITTRPAWLDADTTEPDDPRLDEAARLVDRFGIGSPSFFQRRMRVGLERGQRLTRQLVRRGVLGTSTTTPTSSVYETAGDRS